MEEKLFEEIEKHLLEDKKPSEYIRKIIPKIKSSNLKIIGALEKVEQSPTHHPEGNVLIHTLLVVDGAALVRKYANDKRAVMWGSFFHDIGKKRATRLKKGRIVAYNHDMYGREVVENILSKYTFLEGDFKEKVINLVGYHMHSLYISKKLPFGNLDNMMRSVDIRDMSLLFFADRLGRGDFSKEAIESVIDEITNILNIINEKYDVKDTIDLWDKIRKELI